MTLLQHHILALSLTALTTFCLGLLVFTADPKRRLNQVFGFYSLAIAWWAFSVVFIIGAPDAARASLWSYLNWPLVFFIAPTFLHTVFLLTGQRGRRASIILKAGYMVNVLCLFLHVFFRAIEGPVRPVAYMRFYSGVSTLGLMSPIAFVVLVNIALWRLYRSFQASLGQRRTQLKYLFWASLIGYFGGSPSWFLCFGFHIPVLSPFGIYGIPLYSIATTYAVLHHRLFNVNLVIRRSLVYSILVTLLTVGYFGLIHAGERFFQATLGYQSVSASVVAFAIMALIFRPLQLAVQRLVDFILFRAPREEMLQRLERLERELREADKLKAVSLLTASMAHEIKNPLTAIKTFTSFLREKGSDPAFRETFQRIVTPEVDRIEQLVRHVLEIAKPQSAPQQPVDVSQLLDETLELLNSDCFVRHVKIERTYDRHGLILASPPQLRQIFLNLFLNSLEAMPDGGVLTVSIAHVKTHLTIVIEDTGKGIPHEHLKRLFDPFFTTKPNGTGLGLSVVRNLITEHGGTIAFDSQLGLGTRCTLKFPLLHQPIVTPQSVAST